MSKPLISLCMIVKDEQDNLARCLTSVKDVVDEMIVVDTGSSDTTINIARDFGCKVYQVPWNNDFSQARNVAMDKANGEWILLMDADEELVEEDCQKVIALTHEDAEGYFFQVLSYIGEYAGPDVVSNLNLKLVRNSEQYRFMGAIHEQLASVITRVNPEAKLKISDVRVYHYGYLRYNVEKQHKRRRNIAILEEQLVRYPGETFIVYNLGNEYFALGNYEKALNLYKEVLKDLNPHLGYASKIYIQATLCLQRLGRYGEALKIIQRGLKDFPKLTDLVYIKSDIYHQLGLYSQALRGFKQCVDMGEAPLLYAFLLGVGGYRSYAAMGQIYEELKDYEMAYKHYIYALQQKPDFLGPIYRIGHILFLLLEPEQALNKLEQYFDSTANSKLILADILLCEHRYDMSIDYIEKAAQDIELSPKFLYLKAQCLMYLDRFEEAYRCLIDIPADIPYYTAALKDIVWCFWMQQQWEDAEVAIYFMEQQSLPRHIIDVYKAFFAILKQSDAIQALSGGNESSREYEKIIFEILDRLLGFKRFELFERALNLLNLIDSDDVLMQLGKLYYRYGYNVLAREELLRSIKAFEVYDGESLDMLKSLLGQKA
ncbi:MAG: hypothetical protein PWP48_910 [Clostridiales bacterium]|nr:hypothetical protein [Clostridiales bacterium]